MQLHWVADGPLPMRMMGAETYDSGGRCYVGYPPPGAEKKLDADVKAEIALSNLLSQQQMAAFCKVGMSDDDYINVCHRRYFYHLLSEVSVTPTSPPYCLQHPMTPSNSLQLHVLGVRRSWPRHHDQFCEANCNGSKFCLNPNCTRNPQPALEDLLIAALTAQMELMTETMRLKMSQRKK